MRSPGTRAGALEALAAPGEDALLRLVEGQAEVLELIAEAAPLPRILGRLMEILEAQAEGMLCSILLVSEDGRRVHPIAAPSLPEAYNAEIEGGEIGPQAGSCGTAAHLRRQVIVTDVAVDPLWVHWKDAALRFGLRACWSTPIFSKGGRVLGTFAMYYRQPASPTARDQSLIAFTTHLARIAIERHLADVERARLLAELETAVRARDDFLSIASHELRTPMTSLTLVVQRLRRDAAALTPALIERHLGVLERQTGRLTNLVRDLLDVTQLQHGLLTLRREEVDLGAVVREVAAQLAPELARAGSALSLHLDEEVRGDWDRQRVEQVVTNLLSNAIKFGRGNPIEVKVIAGGEGALLVVSDQGIGIAPERLPRLFGRFERNSVASGQGGLGLGLYIARSIVEALGGRIAVDSTLGVGTSFTVELPYHA